MEVPTATEIATATATQPTPAPSPSPLKQGQVYHLYSPLYNAVYVGATEQTLEERLRAHRDPNEFGRTCSSREIMDDPNIVIEPIEDVLFDRKDELRKREQHHLERAREAMANGGARVVNKNDAYVPFKGYDYQLYWKEKNPNYHKNWWGDHEGYMKAWREGNRDRVRQYNRRYYQKQRARRQVPTATA